MLMLLIQAVAPTSERPFFTNDLEGWIKVVGFLVTVGLMVWGALKARVASDINLRRDIDGVGGRTASLETDRTNHSARLHAVETFMLEARQQQAFIATRLGAVEEAQRSIEKLVREGQSAMAQRVIEIRDVVAGEQSKMRERIVRLEVVNDLRRMGLLKEEEA